MICQSASSSWSHATSSASRSVWARTSSVSDGTPVSIGGRPGRQWQDGTVHGVGVLGPGGGRGPQGPRRPAAGRADRRADHDARVRRPLPPRRDRLPDAGHLGLRGRVRRPAGGPRRRHDRGLAVGIGEDGTDTVFRRSFSALVLAECLERATSADRDRPASPTTTVLRWGDRVAGWLVRERDLRGYVPGKGWAHALAHGADALGVLAQAAADGPAGADRAARRGRRPAADPDPRPAGARRGRPAGGGHHAGRCAATWSGSTSSSRGWPGSPSASEPATSATTTRSVVTGNVQAYLRALHLQVALAPRPTGLPRGPAARADRPAAEGEPRPSSADLTGPVACRTSVIVAAVASVTPVVHLLGGGTHSDRNPAPDEARPHRAADRPDLGGGRPSLLARRDRGAAAGRSSTTRETPDAVRLPVLLLVPVPDDPGASRC